MNSKQFRILIQILEAIRLTLKGPSSTKGADELASQALEDAEALEASEYFREGRHEHC